MKKVSKIDPTDVLLFVESIFGDDVHAKRVGSIADASLGILTSAALGVHAIGRGLAVAKGLEDKSAIKQVDRLLSNGNFRVPSLFTNWVPYVLGDLKEVRLNMDWTDFDPSEQTQLVISMQTHHGRSVPLVWKSRLKSELKNMMETYEEELLRLLHSVIPEGVHVTIVADRGFAKPKLFDFMKKELGFDYVIRIKANINVTDKAGEKRKSGEWVGMNGRMRVLRNVQITDDRYPIETVVCVRDAAMKDSWCIVTNSTTLLGRQIVKLYGRRFTIEEMFRDIKDLRYGMGMNWNLIKNTDRRDRMLLLAALAQSLLTILGQAGEDVGLDRILKVNTSKERSLSLMRQGIMWYERIHNMPEERLVLLMTRFSELLRMHEPFKSVFVME